jgi:tetrahydromethanopterin S-methyltransferase subunit G
MGDAMTVYDQVKKALQDIVAPELSLLRGEMARLEGRINALDMKIDSVRNELLARTDALDKKMDSVRNELLARTDALDERVNSFRNELLARTDALDEKMDSVRNELLARMEGLEREVRISLEIRERLAALEAKVGIARQ